MEGIRCCCRKIDCIYLEHNNAALVGLEKDLETAARLGKVRALCHLAVIIFAHACLVIATMQ